MIQYLDNDTKHLENAFTHTFYKLTLGGGGGGYAPSSVYKTYLYIAFSKYNVDHTSIDETSLQWCYFAYNDPRLFLNRQ